MKQITLEAIEAIDSLFTDEQRNVLEFQIGDFKVTIKEQLKARFGEQFPMYASITRTKIFAANIIRSQEHLINVLAQRQRYLEIWANPNSYSSKMEKVFEVEGRNKNISLQNTQKATESLSSSKTRQGEATRSFDYVGEEEKWDSEDSYVLSTSNIQLHFKKTSTNDVSTAKIVTAWTESLATDASIKEPTERTYREEEERRGPTPEEAYLNSVAVNKSRVQQRNKKLQTLDGFSDSEKKEKNKSENIHIIESINAMNAWNQDPIDIYDRFFNAFYVLFSIYPTCR